MSDLIEQRPLLCCVYGHVYVSIYADGEVSAFKGLSVG